MLEKLLKFDPAQRITVEEALAHPYLEAYHEVDDEVKKEFDIFSKISQRMMIVLISHLNRLQPLRK